MSALCAGALLTACGGHSPAAPGTPAASPTSVSSVVISGLEDHGTFLVTGERVQLRATATHPNGGREDCTAAAQWKSTNGNVVRFDYFTTTTGQTMRMVLDPRRSGRRAGVTGQTPIRVDSVRVRGTVRSRTTPIVGAFVQQTPYTHVWTTDAGGRFEFYPNGVRDSDLGFT